MIKVVILGSWASYVGTDYCDALGIYPDLKAAREDAKDYAWNRWEPDEQEDEEGNWTYSIEDDEGPDYFIEEYDPEKHDMLKAGGGTFEDEFAQM